MGNQLSIETYTARSERENTEFRISIDAVQCRSHGQVTLYEGKKFYEMFYSDDLGVAKFWSKSNSHEWATTQARISDEAFEVAKTFNAVLAGAGQRSGHNFGAVHFTDVVYAKVDEAAFLFAKRIKRGQFYTFESKMDSFKHFIDAKGLVKVAPRSRSFRRSLSLRKRSISVSSTTVCDPAVEFIEQVDAVDGQPCLNPPPYTNCGPPSYEQSEAEARLMQRARDDFNQLGELISYPDVSSRPFPTTHSQNLWASAPAMESPSTTGLRSRTWSDDTDGADKPSWANVLEAFVHYFYTQTRGKCVASNLKGSLDKEGQFTLTTPVFHSLSREYGERDRGEQGIVTVIQNHRCNHLCRPFRDMKSLLVEAKGYFC